MLQFFNNYSQIRSSWFLLILTTLALQLIALYLQHIVEIQPCVMCIYERIALFGILGAAIIGVIAPKSIMRYFAIIFWIYSAWRGLQLTWSHNLAQLYPSPFDSCDIFVNFPSWLPLDKWLPAIFAARGECALIQWQFMSITMTQWLIAIFAIYFILGSVVLISQFSKPKKRNLFTR